MAGVGGPTNGGELRPSGVPVGPDAAEAGVRPEAGAHPPASDEDGDPDGVREEVRRAGDILAGMMVIPLGGPGTPGVLLRAAPEVSFRDRIMAAEDEDAYAFVVRDFRVDLDPQEVEGTRWLTLERERRAAVSVVIRDAEGRVLVTRDRADTSDVMRIPSGGLDEEDESIEDVAIREMQEELGREIEIVGRVAVVHSEFYDDGVLVAPWTTYVLEARLVGEEPLTTESLPEGGELAAVEWVEFDEAHRPVPFSWEGRYAAFDERMDGMLGEYVVRGYALSLSLRHAEASLPQDLPNRDSEVRRVAMQFIDDTAVDPQALIARVQDLVINRILRATLLDQAFWDAIPATELTGARHVFGPNHIAGLVGANLPLVQEHLEAVLGEDRNQILTQLQTRNNRVGIFRHMVLPRVEASGQLVRLHSSISGGEFDPENIPDSEVRRVSGFLNQTLTEETIYEAARARARLDHGALLEQLVDSPQLGTSRAFEGEMGVEQLRWFMSQTEFSRRASQWIFLRDELFPSIAGDGEEGKVDVLDIGPGSEPISGVIEGRNAFTHEPYRLASLDPRARVHVLDFAPETLTAMRTFDGNIVLRASFMLLDERIREAFPHVLREIQAAYGDEWQEVMRSYDVDLTDFLQRTDGEIVGFDRWQGMPVIHIRIPEEAYQGVQIPETLTDVLIDPLEGEWDVVHAHLHEWLQAGLENELLPTATFIRLVDRVKPGGYIVTDPYTSFDGYTQRRPSHSPNPPLMRALGLEAVADFRGQDIPGIVFRKVGPSNEFVREVATLAEKALARARVDHASGASMPPPPPPPAADSAPSALSPRADSLRTNNPYRYHLHRDKPQTIEAAVAEWRRVLNEGDLLRETLRVRALSPADNLKEGVVRLDRGSDGAGFTLTYFGINAPIYNLLLDDQTLAALNLTGSRVAIGSFGAGLLDMTLPDSLPFSAGLQKVARSLSPPVQGVVIEPIELLTLFGLKFSDMTVDVFDVDERAIRVLKNPREFFLLPLYRADGSPLPRDEQMFADIMAGANREIQRSKTSEGAVLVLEVPEEKWRKMVVHHTNIGTELLPQDERRSPEAQQLNIAFYLHTAYFMDPLLQRAAFVKIVDRLAVGGVLVSDYLLSKAEAAMFGLEMSRIGDRYGEDSARNHYGRDRYYNLYHKLATTDFAGEMMGRVTAVQARESAGQGMASVETLPPPQLFPHETTTFGVLRPQLADFSEDHEPHYQKNREAILRAVEHIDYEDGVVPEDPQERRVVMVLGAGPCNDVPLEVLARRFRVILIDLYRPGVEVALERLPADLRRYVTIEERDLGGLITPFGESTERIPLAAYLHSRIDQIVQQSQTPQEARARLAAELRYVTENVVGADFTGGQEVDLLISTMLATQMHSVPQAFYTEEYMRKFSSDPFMENDRDLIRSIITFQARLASSHMQALGRIVSESQGNTLAYVSTDVHEWRRAGSTADAEVERHLIFPTATGSGIESLDDYYGHDASLRVANRFEWNWQDSNYSVMTVQAVVLGSPEPGSPVSGGGGGRTVAGHQALVASLGGEAIVDGPSFMVQGYDGRGMTDEGRQMISGYAAHMARFGDQPVMGISGDAVKLVPEIVPDYLEEDVAGFSIIDGGLSLVGARHAVPVQAANNSLYSVDSDLDNVFTDWHRVLRMNNREDLIPVVQVIRDLDDRQRLLVVLNRIAEDSANVAWLFEEVAELRRAQPHEGAVSRQAVPQQNAGWHVPAAVAFQSTTALRIAQVGVGAR